MLLGLIIPVLTHMKPNVFCFGLSGFAVPCLAFGMSYVVWGERAARRIGEPQNFKSWRPMYWVPLAIFGLFLAFLIRWRMG
jgi:multisubunit Na+/H+ antiporter MnhB subunit